MIIDYFYQNLQKTPNKTALIVAEKSFTYLELSQKIAALSGTLLQKGVRSKSHVAVILPNSVEFVICLLAIAHLGAVIVPLNSTLKPDALLKMIKACDCEFAVASSIHLQTLIDLQAIKPQNCFCTDEKLSLVTSFNQAIQKFSEYKLTPQKFESDLPFIITMTSGSTGDPKPIIFSQGTKIKRAMGAKDCYKLDDSIISIAATPLYHSLAQRLVLLPLILGGTVVVLKHFTPKLWIEVVQKHRVSFSMLVSSQCSSLVQAIKENSTSLKSLKVLVSSSALLSNQNKKALIEAFDCEVHEIYGASEVGTVTNLAPDNAKQKLDTVGNALPGVDLQIVDDNGQKLLANQIGEIICKSPTAFLGYYQRPDQTKQAVRDGFFYTGDMGKLDQDGFLTFSGRKKEIIITGGINVYPKDIEDVLIKSDLLKECAVIGVEDDLFGEVLMAVVVPKNKKDFNVRELQKICLNELADFQQPLGYEVLESLPKNSMGKILKKELRQKFAKLDLTKHLRKIIQR